MKAKVGKLFTPGNLLYKWRWPDADMICLPREVEAR